MNPVFFEQFKNKRASWIECFSGKDRNSILNQIYQMVSNAAVFKIINEARKHMSVNEKGEPEANAMLQNFINRCFFDSQFSSIRRLTDIAYNIEDPKRGIFSLGALLIDMKKNVSLMTRENMFKVDGLEYDYEAISQREDAYHKEKMEKGISTFSVPNEINSYLVKERHEELDVLCGVTADQRTPSGFIQARVFDYLIKKIGHVTDAINLYVKKYVVHAATPGSREHDNAEEVTITFNYFWNAHKVICQVANFVDVYMLSRTYHASFLPVPQYNHFEFVDQPLVTTENVEVLREVWHGFQKETDSWSSWGMKDFKQEVAQSQ